MRTVDESNENYYCLSSINHPKPSPAANCPPEKVSSAWLLGAKREIVINHNGRDYRLRITQNGKLILTA